MSLFSNKYAWKPVSQALRNALRLAVENVTLIIFAPLEACTHFSANCTCSSLIIKGMFVHTKRGDMGCSAASSVQNQCQFQYQLYVFSRAIFR